MDRGKMMTESRPNCERIASGSKAMAPINWPRRLQDAGCRRCFQRVNLVNVDGCVSGRERPREARGTVQDVGSTEDETKK